MTTLRTTVWTSLLLALTLPAMADDDPGLPPPKLEEPIAERSFDQALLGTIHTDGSLTTLILSADGKAMLVQNREDGSAEEPWHGQATPKQLTTIRRALARADLQATPTIDEDDIPLDVETHMLSLVGKDLAANIAWNEEAALAGHDAVVEVVTVLRTIRAQVFVKNVPLADAPLNPAVSGALTFTRVHPVTGDTIMMAVTRSASVSVTTIQDGVESSVDTTLTSAQASSLNAAIASADRRDVPAALPIQDGPKALLFLLALDADDSERSVMVQEGQLDRLGDHQQELGDLTRVLQNIADQVRETAAAEATAGAADVLKKR